MSGAVNSWGQARACFISTPSDPRHPRPAPLPPPLGGQMGGGLEDAIHITWLTTPSKQRWKLTCCRRRWSNWAPPRPRFTLQTWATDVFSSSKFRISFFWKSQLLKCRLTLSHFKWDQMETGRRLITGYFTVYKRAAPALEIDNTCRGGSALGVSAEPWNRAFYLRQSLSRPAFDRQS